MRGNMKQVSVSVSTDVFAVLQSIHQETEESISSIVNRLVASGLIQELELRNKIKIYMKLKRNESEV
jgi:hypothetical protein